jgi:sulfite exporter TauE/SafE
MSLLLTMLPLYLLGNLHCMGMCGPLVMMLGRHRFRYFYFLGRTLSFTLAGMLAGEAGAVLNVLLHHYHIPAVASFFFGTLLLLLGVSTLMNWHYPGYEWLALRLAGTNRTLSFLLLKDHPWPTFLFGFFTILLPCGQTLLVYSACALSGDVGVGTLNGLAFALLTSPSLFFAMQVQMFFGSLKGYYNRLIGVGGIAIGILTLCRGFAEIALIDHWVLNPGAAAQYHIVIF